MFGFERKSSEDIVEVKAVNGNEIDIMCGIFVNKEGRAQVMGCGTSGDIVNALANLVPNILCDVNLPPFMSRKEFGESAISTMKRTFEERLEEQSPEEKTKQAAELESLEALLSDFKKHLEKFGK